MLVCVCVRCSVTIVIAFILISPLIRCEICSQSDVSCDTPLFSSLAMLTPSDNEVLCQQTRYNTVNDSPFFSAKVRVVWNNQSTIENPNNASGNRQVLANLN